MPLWSQALYSTSTSKSCADTVMKNVGAWSIEAVSNEPQMKKNIGYSAATNYYIAFV